jgi:hypothetical protein
LRSAAANCARPALKERGAAYAPGRRAQDAGQHLGRQRVCTRRNHQLAELHKLAILQLLCALIQRFEFRVITSGQWREQCG